MTLSRGSVWLAAPALAATVLTYLVFPQPTAPPCHWLGPPLSSADAGCLTIVNGRVLVIRAWDGRMALPGGTAGVGETAQCTAHRETWEETGYSLQVQALHRTLDNGFHLFHCAHVGGGSVMQDPRSELPLAPRRFSIEVHSVYWLRATQLNDYVWRFPSQVALLEAALKSAE